MDVLDLLDDAVIIRDVDGRVLEWNQAAELLYKIPRGAALGQPLSSLFEQRAEDGIPKSMSDLTDRYEWSAGIFRKANGTAASVSVVTKQRVRRDGEGRPIAIVEISRREAPNESGEGTLSLLSAMATTVVELDISTVAAVLTDWNDRSCGHQDLVDEADLVRTIMAQTRIISVLCGPESNHNTLALNSELSGAGVLSLWPEESAAEFVHALRAAVLGRAAKRECRMLRKGVAFDAQVTTVPTTSAQGRLCLLLGISDISGQKEAYSRLEASEIRFRHLFQFMPIGLTQVDASRLVEMFNDLRKQGVEDLGPYIDDHPEFLGEALEAMHVEEVNDHNVLLFGANSPQEMKGPVTRYWQEALPTIRRSLEARYRGEDFFQEHARVTRFDGKAVDVLYAAARHGRSPGKSLVAFMDISDQKAAEEALRRSERRYQDLFQAMTVSFWELDLSDAGGLIDQLHAEGVGDLSRYFREHPECVSEVLKSIRIVDVNDQTLSLFGGQDKEVLLGTIDQFWCHTAWEDCAIAVGSVLKDGNSVTIDTRLRRLNGLEFDAQFTLWFAGYDKLQGLAAVSDISERVNAYSQLEKSEQRYRELFQLVPVPVLQVNSNGLLALLDDLKRKGVKNLNAYCDENPHFLLAAMEGTLIERANDAAAKLLGAATPSDLRGSVAPLWREHPEIYSRLLLSRYADVATFEEEVRLSTLDGRIREGILTVTFLPSLAERGITLNAFMDTTEKNQAERKIRQIEAEYAHAARISMLGELTASIAHEVNQPLAAITTYGEAALRWLSRPKPELSEVHEIVKRIVADAQRAANVISRIRTMASRRAPDPEALLLDDVIAEAILFLKHEFQASRIAVRHLPARQAMHVAGDRTQLQQVIVNLAVNAVQAMSGCNGSPRTLSFTTTCEPSAIRCCIEDSGPGISETANLVFQSFFTTKENGMGMGLPICRSIVEAHGGTISFDNNSSLGGARFSIVLPLAVMQ
ncbi:ATP-binding protein [Rhizobium halophilum]|uniref:ATP-binding protein n=1 Tax=Rhizobium halophilum TaxID=2846852 RepID=UPI001EFCFC9D|nr:ATP-binding protein [Rhizobium halophilum]MCF6371133.1 PAS domain-containing protein [Rhizobium halophilum]